MSCIVNLTLKEDQTKEETNIVYVPFHSIFSVGVEKNPSVWIVDKGSMTVSKRSVEVGQMVRQDFVQALSGLSSGETIVTAGVSQLQEGQKVKFVEERL